MDRRTQNLFVMTVLILLLIGMAVVFAVVESGGGVLGASVDQAGQPERSPVPWPIFIPIGAGVLIPFLAQKQGRLKAASRRDPEARRARTWVAVLLILTTAAFMASVSFVVLRTYLRT